MYMSDFSIKERKEEKTVILIFLVGDCRLNQDHEEKDISSDWLEREEEDGVCVKTYFGDKHAKLEQQVAGMLVVVPTCRENPRRCQMRKNEVVVAPEAPHTL